MSVQVLLLLALMMVIVLSVSLSNRRTSRLLADWELAPDADTERTLAWFGEVVEGFARLVDTSLADAIRTDDEEERERILRASQYLMACISDELERVLHAAARVHAMRAAITPTPALEPVTFRLSSVGWAMTLERGLHYLVPNSLQMRLRLWILGLGVRLAARTFRYGIARVDWASLENAQQDVQKLTKLTLASIRRSAQGLSHAGALAGGAA